MRQSHHRPSRHSPARRTHPRQDMRARLPQGDLPPEQPLAMPVQDFAVAPAAVRTRLLDDPCTWRRAALIGGSGLIGVVSSCGVATPLAIDGLDLIDQLIALTSFLLFAWIGFGFLSAAAGFLILTHRRRSTSSPPPMLCGRTALLVPVYNEAVGPLERRLAAMLRSLEGTGQSARFDLFVLSDSRPAAEGIERAACQRLRGVGQSPVHYRRRPFNEARKPGNIADWVRRFGGGYLGMIVLDADSFMEGAAMVRLAAALEADPALGLIQTMPLLTGGRTLFARWQQFAAALYGPIASAGLHWWSGDEATFWGHNAILRVAAFAQCCGLPRLPGPEPFGGDILSHDMVEAALIRRHGWRARMLPMSGSFEESPPTLIDHGIRDRRWCQGNLQHLRLLDIAGLHWVSRLQLLMGASAYLTAPLWLALLLLGLVQTIRTGTPMADLDTPVWLITLTLALLFGTKLLALGHVALEPGRVAALGGWRSIGRSIAAELPLAIVAAPIVMASQCLAIAEILAGRPSGWQPQRRETEGIALGEAFDRYRWHMLLGFVFWSVALSELSGALWGLPVAVGLLGAPFVATLTSRADHGARAAKLGIFATDPALTPAPLHEASMKGAR